MKTLLRMSVTRGDDPPTEARLAPPRDVRLVGRGDVVIGGADGILLFDHLGEQFRLHPLAGMTGRLSFGSYAGPFESLASWLGPSGQRVPIALRNRACGELRLEQTRIQFIHAPDLSDGAGERGSANASAPVPLGHWRCPRCRRVNPPHLMFCLGCGDEAVAVVPPPARLPRGSLVTFQVDGATRHGWVLSGPRGPHHTYVVECGEDRPFVVPAVLMERPESS